MIMIMRWPRAMVFHGIYVFYTANVFPKSYHGMTMMMIMTKAYWMFSISLAQCGVVKINKQVIYFIQQAH